MTSRRLTDSIFTHWYFWIALPLLVAIEAAFAFTLPWSEYPRAEWVVLFDMCVFLPALHAVAYRNAVPRRALVVRTLAIAGLGLWLSRYLVPVESQQALLHLGRLHEALIGVAIVFELGFAVLLTRAMFSRDADAAHLERDFALPPFVARLIMWEARFWKSVAGWFRRRK